MLNMLSPAHQLSRLCRPQSYPQISSQVSDHLYGSNISAADFAGKTGAYDVRITITDKAGNAQIQTVSPAFFIGNSSKIDDILNPDEEGTTVYYDLFGRKVANPLAGIYVKIVNGKATKVAIK